MMFLYSLIVAVLSFSAAAELNKVPTELDNLNTVALLIMFAAIYVFVGGIGMAGWIRSRVAGILTTVFALFSTCLITYAIGKVISLFM
jgi:cytochrome b561